jgi:Lar family restriction alleviation protein
MKLKPCPFCGSDKIIMIKIDSDGDDYRALACSQCKTTSNSASVEEVIFDYLGLKWNTRIKEAQE